MESERIYIMLDRIEGKVDSHTNMIARLEARQHTPNDCPGVKRIENILDKHFTDHEQSRRDAGMKAFARETAKVIVAGITGAIAAMGMKG